MMRALFAGVTGLRNHQTRMDAIGNNIANVNTVGFKAGRVTFKDAFSQTFQGASRPGLSAGSGPGGFGTDPIQVGLGMNIGGVDIMYTQGNLQNTGIQTDLAIQGEGMFVISDGRQQYFTRAGNFQFDALGRLVASANGFIVQGRMAQNGVLSDTVSDIALPVGQKAAAQATTVASLGGNLDAAAALGDTQKTTIVVYDTLGAQHDLEVTFTKTVNPGEWDFSINATDGTIVSGDTGTMTFDGSGALIAPETNDFVFTPDNLTLDQTITLEFGTAGSIDGLSQFASPSTAVVREQDGYTMGELRQILIDNSGTITGTFANGTTQVLAQVALANFNNPGGLSRQGDNMFTVSSNSGSPVIGFSGQGIQSSITAGALEMSNVDLAEQFTDMITTQRGFQSIARVITTSDEMLQELVNLRR